MFGRFVERRAEEALPDTPVVLIVGPRRAGKATLVRKMGNADRTYIKLDDQTVLAAAHFSRNPRSDARLALAFRVPALDAASAVFPGAAVL